MDLGPPKPIEQLCSFRLARRTNNCCLCQTGGRQRPILRAALVLAPPDSLAAASWEAPCRRILRTALARRPRILSLPLAGRCPIVVTLVCQNAAPPRIGRRAGGYPVRLGSGPYPAAATGGAWRQSTAGLDGVMVLGGWPPSPGGYRSGLVEGPPPEYLKVFVFRQSSCIAKFS